MSELEETTKGDLWKMVKTLREDGVDIGDLSYGSPKEDLIALITNQDSEEKEEEVPEIADIDDVPEEEEETEEVPDEPEAKIPEEEEEEEEEPEEAIEDEDINCPECGELLEEAGPCPKCEEEEEDVAPPLTCYKCDTPLKEDGSCDCVEEEEIIEKPIIKIPEPIYEPKPKFIKLANSNNLRSYIGENVELNVSWFRGGTSMLVDGNFVIKKFQKNIPFKGKLSIRMYQWIRTKRLKIGR